MEYEILLNLNCESKKGCDRTDDAVFGRKIGDCLDFDSCYFLGIVSERESCKPFFCDGTTISNELLIILWILGLIISLSSSSSSSVIVGSMLFIILFLSSSESEANSLKVSSNSGC